VSSIKSDIENGLQMKAFSRAAGEFDLRLRRPSDARLVGSHRSDELRGRRACRLGALRESIAIATGAHRPMHPVSVHDRTLRRRALVGS
jgi:hypothetical protein